MIIIPNTYGFFMSELQEQKMNYIFVVGKMVMKRKQQKKKMKIN